MKYLINDIIAALQFAESEFPNGEISSDELDTVLDGLQIGDDIVD
jgi:hypothetical protein